MIESDGARGGARYLLLCLVLGSALSTSLCVAADYAPTVAPNATRLLWGDTHLHTRLSLDARAFGVTLSPDDAYRFARGEVVTATHGERVRLAEPLDFLVVSDHSDALGAMNEIIDGNPALLSDPVVRNWHEMIREGGRAAQSAVEQVITYLTEGRTPEVLLDRDFARSIWRDYVDAADRYDDPGTFTALIGYEWTSTPGGKNLHRNVLYRDGADTVAAVLPYTAAESTDPRDLWKWMAAYEEATGGEVLALAHNGNLSNGWMFPDRIDPASGDELDADYARDRARWEPLYEVTQIKGDGEAHPMLSPNDEFADYETWDKGEMGTALKENWMLEYEYARSALLNGLEMEARLGTNPYKFGMIGSTDSHTGLATADENNFFGKHAGMEPRPERWSDEIARLSPDFAFIGWEQVASGYAAVWATENTRAALFDAFRRKEVYATTGTRMRVRFFGGWGYEDADADAGDLAAVGYAGGVPMGGDLPRGAGDAAPRFLIAASRDPLSAPLDRIQIVKGWLDAEGETREQVFDVALSDGRDPANPAPVGSTVDAASATFTQGTGAAELRAVWRDPDFDPQQRAFWYVRVIEAPTPRWTAYDARHFDVEMDDEVPMTTQERAYTSPIWYTP